MSRPRRDSDGRFWALLCHFLKAAERPLKKCLRCAVHLRLSAPKLRVAPLDLDSAMNSWALIYNPRAGSFRLQILERLHAMLRHAGKHVRLMPTTGPGDAERLAHSAAAADRVAVYGGDGTLNEAANGLLGARAALIFLPGGTANVMAHELNLPTFAPAALSLLMHAKPVALRPGMLEQRAFLLMAGFGYDADVARSVSPRWKARLGKASYLAAGCARLLRRGVPLHIQGAPAPEQTAPQFGAQPSRLQAVSPQTRPPAGTMEIPSEWPSEWIVVSRARCYAGAFVLHAQAGLEHPQLGWTCIRRGRCAQFLCTRLAFGRTPSPNTAKQWLTEATYRVRAEHAFAAQVDGEFFGMLQEATVGLSSQSLRLCTLRA